MKNTLSRKFRPTAKLGNVIHFVNYYRVNNESRTPDFDAIAWAMGAPKFDACSP